MDLLLSTITLLNTIYTLYIVILMTIMLVISLSPHEKEKY